VLIEAGEVTAIDGIPFDTYIKVRNYDIEGVASQMIAEDENGRPCQILEWRAPE
jgi:hypothetical protein